MKLSKALKGFRFARLISDDLFVSVEEGELDAFRVECVLSNYSAAQITDVKLSKEDFLKLDWVGVNRIRTVSGRTQKEVAILVEEVKDAELNYRALIEERASIETGKRTVLSEREKMFFDEGYILEAEFELLEAKDRLQDKLDEIATDWR